MAAAASLICLANAAASVSALASAITFASASTLSCAAILAARSFAFLSLAAASAWVINAFALAARSAAPSLSFFGGLGVGLGVGLGGV